MEQTQELTIIERSLEIFRGGGAILLAHQGRASKALQVGKSILEQWAAADAITDEEERRAAYAAADERSNKFLVNCNAGKSEMEDNRKAITQLMDEVKKMFTAEEAKMDVKKGEIPLQVQNRRNQYAKTELEYQEKKRKEAEAKAAKAKEEAEIRAAVKNSIATVLIDFLARKKQTVTDAFNKITLADYDSKSAGLQAMSCVFPVVKLDELLFSVSRPATYRHNAVEVDTIVSQEKAAYDFNAFYNEYGRRLTELKQSLIDRLPAKKQELDEQKRLADEAEAERQAELKRQQEAEQRRQQEMAKAKDEAERKRKEQEAEAERKREADRLAAMERDAEEKRLAAIAEQQRREKEEADRLAAEAEAAKKKAGEDAEISKAAGVAQALFDETSEAAVTSPAPEVRSGFDIKVLGAAGWVEIFTFWFQREGVTMSVEDIGNKKLDQMKKFVEKVANKSGEKIESKYLRYETDVKSVNRRAK